jgi:hypothetical protein
MLTPFALDHKDEQSIKEVKFTYEATFPTNEVVNKNN